MVSKLEWEALDRNVDGDLPPDLTEADGPYCAARCSGYTCTRRPGHTGRHAAGNGLYIVAVWRWPLAV